MGLPRLGCKRRWLSAKTRRRALCVRQRDAEQYALVSGRQWTASHSGICATSAVCRSRPLADDYGARSGRWSRPDERPLGCYRSRSFGERRLRSEPVRSARKESVCREAPGRPTCSGEVRNAFAIGDGAPCANRRTFWATSGSDSISALAWSLRDQAPQQVAPRTLVSTIPAAMPLSRGGGCRRRSLRPTG
jgi:hypothetical protein